MSADSYLRAVLGRITAPTGAFGPGANVRIALLPTIRAWAGTQLNGVQVSGSYAKETAVVGGTDVDLFISLKTNTTETLAEIYDGLALRMSQSGYNVRSQNVSIGIDHGPYRVDLTPGKQQSAWTSEHSIYVLRQRTWKQTNVDTHVQTVRNSGRTEVIRLLKHWRNLHGLEFQSFALELAVLRALYGTWSGGLASQVRTALAFFRDTLSGATLMDPANTNNNVASEVTAVEKSAVAAQARASLGEQDWQQVIW